MEDLLFQTKEQKNSAITDFQSLLQNTGWLLVVKIVKLNIEVLKKQLLDGIENETKEDIDRIRDKIKLHEEFIAIPEKGIKELNEVEVEEVDLDPYDKGEDKKD